jgi:hypothetical protein
LNALGSLGRKLITTDLVNRTNSIDPAPGNLNGRFNPSLSLVTYRANQGLSSYNAFSATARYQGRAAQWQVAYTWGHAIDNQSEPLAGAFDLGFTSKVLGSGRSPIATFFRQFDNRGDRASADFDQRHNLVFYSIWQIPPLGQSSRAGMLWRGWQIAVMAAARSGFPYTVTAPGTLDVPNRAHLIDPERALARSQSTGGVRLLNKEAFQEPLDGTHGTLGRNTFEGPGLANIDASLSRTFALPWLGESGRVTFRADAFNLLNHANLNNPAALLGASDFGLATYGRRGRSTGFPAQLPLDETPRQVQLILRVSF